MAGASSERANDAQHRDALSGLAAGRSQVFVLGDCDADGAEDAVLVPAEARERKRARDYDGEERDALEQAAGGLLVASAGATSCAAAGDGWRRNVRKRLAVFEDEPEPKPKLEPEPEPKDETALVDLDDAELQAVLARTRREKTKFSVRRGEDAASAVFEPAAGAAQPDSVGGGGVVVFSESTDFISAVGVNGSVDNTNTNSKADRPVTAAQTPLPSPALPAPPAPPAPPAQADVEREPLVRRGVAATLRFLEKIGLRPQLATEDGAAARRRPSAYARFSEIKIEHYDAEGNLLTPREAYKALSHTFHGKAPGKTKLGKIAQRRAEAHKVQAASLADTPLGTASALRERQRTTGAAHIVLSQGSHSAPIEANAIAAGDLQRPARAPAAAAPPPAVKRKTRIFGMR